MWEKVKLGEVCKLVTGKTPPTKNEKYFSDELMWLTPADFTDKYLKKTQRGVSFFARSERKINLIPANSLFITCIGNIGKLTINKVEACSNQQITALCPINENINVEFLYYYLQTIQKYLSSIANNAVVPIINNGTLGEIQIPLPPLPIQEKIAEILDKADELRRKDKDLQEKYDELAQAIFIDMFGDPVKNEKGWEVKNLEKVCTKITDGTHHSPQNTSAGKKYITAKHIKNAKLDFFRNETYVSEDDHKSIYSRCNPEFGDVLYIKDGATTGMAAVNDLNEEFSMLSSLALFKLDTTCINNNYLVYYLNSEIVKDDLIREFMAGAAIKRFTLSKIKKFNIVLPPIHLQEAFAKKIEIINQLKAQTNAEKTEELFQSLLQKAFKGELVS